MFTNFQRIYKFALDDFSRNMGRSLSAIFVLVITILFITGFFFLHGISNFIIAQVENKIDITAYFKTDTAQEDILNVKDSLVKDFPDVKNVQYVSKEQALSNFTQRHQGDSVFTNALTQVGDNPFLPSLNVTTSGASAQYQALATELQSEKYSSMIEKVDFSDKKATIEKIFSITSGINIFALVMAIILALVVIVVVFNTIKLAIEGSKDEISTMTIVGASSWFVRAPFIVQGMLFGCVSFVICFAVTGFVVFLASGKLITILGGFSLWQYFLSNLLIIILIQLVFAVALGVISSFIVVSKYLKV